MSRGDFRWAWLFFAFPVALSGAALFAAFTRTPPGPPVVRAPGQLPNDPAYQHALKLGLAHHYGPARAEFLRLAREKQGQELGAWSLYQAGLAAQALHQPAVAAQTFAELRRAYPNHLLAIRTGGHSGPVRPRPAATPADADCGPRALLLACQPLHATATVTRLREAAGTTPEGTTLEGLARAARGLGLKAEGVQVDREALADLRPPAVAWVDGHHFVAVLHTSDDRVTIHDPNQPREETWPLNELLTRSGGVLLRLSR